MWILESNGDFLQGKRMWLKPGKKYLFGRVKKDGVRFAIDHKTVSRKHFVITIDPVRDQDVGQVHARTKVTITDENSKAGTNIDGELIRGKSQELKNPVNSIRPGSCPHELLIKWQPCVMTFMLNKKEIKNGDLKIKQDQVKDLDIRAVSDYLTGQTTHLVAQKRNTAKGLQALIEGNPILTEAYIDALIYASTPIDLQEEENPCPLETDFDESWPDATLHLPPPGKEPTDKPAEAYKPDPARAKVFDKYTFIFFDSSQYDTLLPPITTGHGKALLFKVDADTTTVEQGYDFIKKASSNIGRTVIVNVNETNDMRPWLTEYIDSLCSKFNLEPASQSDFLDTVLANDASQLRKPRTRDVPQSSKLDNGVSSRASGNQVGTKLANGSSNGHKSRVIPAVESQLSEPSQMESAPAESVPQQSTDDTSQQSRKHDDNPRPTKRARFIPPKKPRAAFDDDFDPDAIAECDEEPSPPKTQSRNRPSATTQNKSDNVSIKQEPVSTSRDVRNGSAQSSDHSGSEDDEMDDLLPATAAMTRDKARQVAEARAKGIKIPSPTSAKPPAKPKKEVKLMDVREVVRAQREAEQDKERKERAELDDLHAEAETSTGPANLVTVTTFELPIHKRIENDGTNGYKGESWKPEWDDRKNFKGFRRARDVAAGTAEAPRRKEKIIIPLEPARRQDYGLGEKYWEKTQEEKEKAARDKEKRKKASQRTQSQTQKEKQANQSQHSGTVHEDSGSDDDDEDGANSAANESEPEEEHVNAETSRLQAEAEGVLDHPIDIDAPRQTRGGETQTSASTRSTTTKNSAKVGKAGSKRPASKTPPSSSNRVAPKRQKILPITVVHGSDSEDGDDSDDLKFKVGRGRKARTGKK